MEAQEFVLAIIAMAIGGAVIITAIVKGVELIKTWINRNNASYDEEKFERLAKAFIQHKKDSDRRFQNIGAIGSNDESVPASTPSSNRTPKHNKQHQSIEIESDHPEDDNEESGNLHNMLNKKKIR